MPLLEKELLHCEQCGAPLESGSTALGCLNCLLLGGLNKLSAESCRFQHYQVCLREDGALCELGRGAMGITYRALDINLDSPVALKVISGRFSENAEARERFRREARAAAKLRHPNVASVFHFGETVAGQCFYAMELVEGETLEARVQHEGQLPIALALNVAEQVARALIAADAHGLVHRDLKPSNFMLFANDSDGTDALVVKVIDFGLAKAIAEIPNAPLQTHTSFSGTPEFASPEQFSAGKVSLDARSDIYSLGATLWYLLCGRAPFAGRTPGKIHDHALPLDQLAAVKVPAGLIALLRSMLATDPEARPQSARELLGALRACRQVIEAKPRRRRQLAAAAIALALIIIGAVSLTRYVSRRASAPAGKAVMAKPPTADARAYAMYNEAKALGVQNDWKLPGTRAKQTELLQGAIRRDRNFVLAYCLLAQVYAYDYAGVFYTGADVKPAAELWKAAIDTALRLRPDLGEPHLELARYYLMTHEFDRAREEVTIARRLLPNDSGALFVAARIDRRQNRWEEALASAIKANELNPHEKGLYDWLVETYLFMRRYIEGEEFLRRSIAKLPEMTDMLNAEMARLKLAEGDPVAAQKILAELPPNIDLETSYAAALYQRDYDTATRVIAAATAEKVEEIYGGKPPLSLADGEIARARGDSQKAQAAFLNVRTKLEAKAIHETKDQFYFLDIAACDAALGHKEEAIRRARGAVEQTPLSKDPVFGLARVRYLALVYAWTGELRLNPCWDSLRNDPRFEKILAAPEPKTIY